MNISGKTAAQAFRKKYGILKPTLNQMRDIIDSQGYTIVEFNAIFNDENVSAIIDELNLNKLISEQKGFTYADSKYRLVFVHEDLSDEEKLIVLSHEEGHIFCGHIEENSYLGRDVQQELEVNEFVYCLLNPVNIEKVVYFLKRKKILVSAIAIILIVSMVCVGWFMREKELYGDFYITDTGSKYHQAECIHIKNKTNVHRLTVEQFESGEYQPCKTCLPQG